MARLRDLLGRYTAKAAPPMLQNYVVRITHPTRHMRTLVIRAADEGDAVDRAITKLSAPELDAWALLDVVTLAESRRRSEGLRSA